MNLTRRKFVQNVAVGSAAFALASRLRGADHGPVTKRPNLLFIMTDQHRSDVMPHAGNTVIQAPNLAALAKKSFVFSDAYCTEPVCTPSRGSIFTGLMPHNHRSIVCDISLSAEFKSIAEYMPPEYATAYMGKWHLGDELVAQHGFKEWISVEDLIHRDNNTKPEYLKLRSSYHQFLLRNGFPPDTTDPIDNARLFSFGMQATMSPQYSRARFLGSEAERFLRERRDGQPFVLALSIPEPHPPIWGPYNDRYQPGQIPTGPSFGKPVGEDAARLHRRIGERFRTNGYDGHSMDDLDGLRRVAANYYGLITLADEAIGGVLRALEESGQAENTIVVFTADHGEMLGEHAMMGKLVMYEGAVRVPLMIHVPWLSNGQLTLKGPISLVDLTPTLLELMGREIPAVLDGRSRAGALREPGTWRAENIVVEWNDFSDRRTDCRSLVTTDGWKLNTYRDDHPECFNLNLDPHEMNNLARDPGTRDRMRQLYDSARDWQGRHRDLMPLAG